jgi:hypothetical protein
MCVLAVVELPPAPGVALAVATEGSLGAWFRE